LLQLRQLFCGFDRLCGRKSSEGEVFDQVIQRFAVSAGKGSKPDADSRFLRVGFADPPIRFEGTGLGDPYVHSVAHGQARAKKKQAADAQIVRGIFDANRIGADFQFYGLVQQHTGERSGVGTFHVERLLKSLVGAAVRWFRRLAVRSQEQRATTVKRLSPGEANQSN
jgi:hypothetical protein